MVPNCSTITVKQIIYSTSQQTTMKKMNIAIGFLLFTMTALAQRGEPVNPQKDKREFKGYTIRLLPAMGGTYGYDIIKGKQRVVHQSYNPFTNSPMGLRKKEDAYKVAQWQIQQLKEGKELSAGRSIDQEKTTKLPPTLARNLRMQGSNGPQINQRISKKVAEELKINISH
jgi:hypothetical protein